jgi:hypothetical protein
LSVERLGKSGAERCQREAILVENDRVSSTHWSHCHVARAF